MIVRRAIVVLLAGAHVACALALVDPAGRACDDAHPCAGGRVCVAGLCSSMTPIEAGATADAAAPADAATSANLHPDGTFESGCGRWVAYQSTAAPSSAAHTGGGACELCGAQADFTLDDKGFLPSPRLGRYRAQAWARIEPGHPASEFGILLRTVNAPNPSTFEEVEKKGSGAQDTSGWQEVSVDLDVTRTADLLNVVVFVKKPTCLLIDDVRVEQLP